MLGALCLAVPIGIGFAILWLTGRNNPGSMAPGFLAFIWGGIGAVVVSAIAFVASLVVAKAGQRSVSVTSRSADPPDGVAPWIKEMRQERERGDPPAA